MEDNFHDINVLWVGGEFVFYKLKMNSEGLYNLLSTSSSCFFLGPVLESLRVW